MSEPKDRSNQIDIILPKAGVLVQEDIFYYILCKPKLMSLKSLTLEKMEKIQKDAEKKLKEAKEAQEKDSEEAQ